MTSISVIIPSYNYAQFLGDAIESVLKQTQQAAEIIVVDDGSTDHTTDIANRYSDYIHYIYQKNAGIGAARNVGIQHATGDYLTFLDADDLWPKHKLERQLNSIKYDNSIDMIFGHVKHFYCPNISEEAKKKLECPSQLIAGQNASTMLISTKKFHQVGYFDTDLSTGEFIAWYLKAKQQNLSQLIVDDMLLMRRIHDGHLTVRKRRNYRDYLKILRSKLHNKRSIT